MPLKAKPTAFEFSQLDEATLNVLAASFDLGTIIEVEAIVFEGDRAVLLDDKSQTSRKLVLRTNKGRYFLKQIPWYCDSLHQVKLTHKFMKHLAKQGLPIPQLYNSSTGTSWTELNGVKFAAMEYISGYPYKGRTIEQHTISRTLAQIHLAAAFFQWDFDAPRESLLQIVQDHINLARQQPGCSPDVGRVLDKVELHCRTFLDTPQELLKIPVHGDFIPWNIALAKDQVVAIYDFDNCCIDSRLHDLGEAIVSFYALNYRGHSSQLHSSLQLDLPIESTRSFLQSYESINPLSGTEYSSLPAYVLGAWWECILLSFIRGEQRPENMHNLLILPGVVSQWWESIRTDDILRHFRW